MKNKIFKVCALGLVTTMILTGCGSKEGKVQKIQKNEEISYEKKGNVISESDKYYGLEVYQFTNSYQLEADYETEIEFLLQDEEVINVNALTKEKNMYEAILTLDADYYEEKQYAYVLYIKNDTDYVVLYQTSNNSNKEEIIKIGNELKEKIKNSKNYLKIFNEFAMEKDLKIDGAYGSNGIVSCKTALLASNVKQKDYEETTDKVVTVEEGFYQLSRNSGKVIVEARTSDGKIVWSIDEGSVPVGIGFEGTIANQVGNLFLMSEREAVVARDIQTSQIVWKSDIHGALVHEFTLANDKIFDIQGDIQDSLEVKDYKTGKTLYYEDNISKYVVRDATIEYDYYSIVGSSAKIENGYIVYDVVDDDKDDAKVGKLRINTNDYKIVFER